MLKEDRSSSLFSVCKCCGKNHAVSFLGSERDFSFSVLFANPVRKSTSFHGWLTFWPGFFFLPFMGCSFLVRFWFSVLYLPIGFCFPVGFLFIRQKRVLVNRLKKRPAKAVCQCVTMHTIVYRLWYSCFSACPHFPRSTVRTWERIFPCVRFFRALFGFQRTCYRYC